MVWEDPLITILVGEDIENPFLVCSLSLSSRGLGNGSEGRGKSEGFGILFIYLL